MHNHDKPSAEERLQQWIKPELLGARAYHVPDAEGLIKLDAMENPYLLPVELQEEILQVITGTEINRYPDPDASDLKQSRRVAMDIPGGMEIMLGNGSDELIQIIDLAVAHSGKTILAPEPGFVMYKIIADTVGAEYVGVDLDRNDFSLDGEAMLSAINEQQPRRMLELLARHYPSLEGIPVSVLGMAFKPATDDIRESPALIVVPESSKSSTAVRQN